MNWRQGTNPRLALALGVFVFVVNPLACAPGDEFEFDEADMRRLAEGTWTISMGPQRDNLMLPRARYAP